MTDPFMNPQKCVDRLFADYKNHGNSLIVAFDFDNTIHDYHHAGDTFPRVSELLQQASNIGLTMVCFTGNSDTQLVMDTCKKLGIKLHGINESPVKLDTNKLFYNILLDDRAGLSAAYDTLKETVKLIIKEEVSKL